MFSFKNACDGAYDSLDIRFLKACDNDCPFCIERDGLDKLGNTDVDAMIQKTIDSGIRDVLILGGEPFLLPAKLLQYIKGIRGFATRIFITTSLPKSVDIANPTILEIFELIDGLNVSIQSVDWQENNRLLRASSNHDRLEILHGINSLIPDKVRTSINLVAGGIDNAQKLYDTLDRLIEIGCMHFKINELQHTPDLFVSYEAITGTRMKSAFAFGCQTYVESYKGARILVKRSCHKVEQSVDPSWFDIAKLLIQRYVYRRSNKFNVLYEDANLRNTWEKKQKEGC